MRRDFPVTQSARRLRRVGAIAATVLALSMLAVPTALAAPPVHYPASNPTTEFAAGDVCTHAIRFENLTLRNKETDFAPAPDGSSRSLIRGFGDSLVTDLDTGATFAFRGGTQFTITFAADGSVRYDAHGRDFIAWYFPGDDSNLGPGLFQVNGRLTEWYAPDGSFIRAEANGAATNLCEALAGWPFPASPV